MLLVFGFYDNVAMSICAPILCGYVFLLGQYLGMELLGCMVYEYKILFNVFERNYGLLY